jgi:hypothetical protein
LCYFAMNAYETEDTYLKYLLLEDSSSKMILQ